MNTKPKFRIQGPSKSKDFVPTFAGAYNYGLTVLGYKSYSENEIRDKIVSKGYSVEMARSAVGKLIEYGFCDDVKYGDALFRGWLAKGGRGKQHLRQLLVKHKLRQDVVQNLLEELDSRIEAELLDEAMQTFILRNRKKIATAQDYVSQRKIMAAASRFLGGRGFTNINGSLIADYLKEAFANEE